MTTRSLTESREAYHDLHTFLDATSELREAIGALAAQVDRTDDASLKAGMELVLNRYIAGISEFAGAAMSAPQP